MMENELKQHGYRSFAPPACMYPKATRGWEKWFYCDGRKIYYIHIYQYPNGNLEAFGQFISNGATFNIILMDVFSISQVNRFFEDIFEKMNCSPYFS